LLSQRRQVRKQFFETDPGRDFLGQEKALHDTLDFREGRRKAASSRVSKDQGLGYAASSYKRRSMERKVGVARKSVCLTRSKRRPEIGENPAFLIAEALAYN
jgi:hypothetical protein